jgi:phosphopantothenoylcysteine decarboxylase/phosphopantothenate--cysteine ligase
VILISGPVTLAALPGIETIRVETAAEMHDAVMGRFAEATIVIKAAAVADFRPALSAAHKIKKGAAQLTLELEPTIDILAVLGRVKGNRFLVGFAAETQNLLAEGHRKLIEKNCDLLVANLVGQPGTGFDADANEVRVLNRAGGVAAAGPAPKREIAHFILDRISETRAAASHTGTAC